MNQVSAQLQPSVEQSLAQYGLVYKIFECNPDYADTALFCEHYQFSLEQSANAIITASRTDPIKYACCLVLATHKIDVNKKVCQLLGVKKASFASAEQAMELTGMTIGGVTPFGLPKMRIYVDSAVMINQEIIVGGGNRSTKVLLNPQELLKIPNVEVVEGLAIAK